MAPTRRAFPAATLGTLPFRDASAQEDSRARPVRAGSIRITD